MNIIPYLLFLWRFSVYMYNREQWYKFEMTLMSNVHTKTTLSIQLNLDMFGNSCTENAFYSFILSEVSLFVFKLLIYFKVDFKFGFILLRYIIIYCCFWYELLFIRLKKKASYEGTWGFVQFSSIAWKVKFIFLTFHWTLEKYGLNFFLQNY